MNRIKCLRASRSLTQAKFAELFFVDQTAVSNWEKEKNNIDLKTLEQISEVFQVPIEFIIGKPFELKLPLKKWRNDQLEDYEHAGDAKDYILFKFGRGYFPKKGEDSTAPTSIDESRAALFRDIDQMDEEQIKDLENYVDFLKSRKKSQ